MGKQFYLVVKTFVPPSLFTG